MIDIDNVQSKLYNVVGVLYEVHNTLGPGLSERIYQEGLSMELKLRNIPFEREKLLRPSYKGVTMSLDYRIDFLVDDIIIELKAVESLTVDHRSQLFNYMHLFKPVAGVLVNFSPSYCVIERYLYDEEQRKVLTVRGEPITKQRS